MTYPGTYTEGIVDLGLHAGKYDVNAVFSLLFSAATNWGGLVDMLHIKKSLASAFMFMSDLG